MTSIVIDRAFNAGSILHNAAAAPAVPPAYGTMDWIMLGADARKALGPPAHFSPLQRRQWKDCPTGFRCGGCAYDRDLCLDDYERRGMDAAVFSDDDGPDEPDGQVQPAHPGAGSQEHPEEDDGCVQPAAARCDAPPPF